MDVKLTVVCWDRQVELLLTDDATLGLVYSIAEDLLKPPSFCCGNFATEQGVLLENHRTLKQSGLKSGMRLFFR